MSKIRYIAIMATVIIFATTAIFVGCKKEDNKVIDKTQVLSKNQVQKIMIDDGSEITFEDIERLADKHNEYLDDIFVNFDFESDDYEQELLNSIKEANLDDATEEEKQYLCDKIIEGNLSFETEEHFMAMIESAHASGIIEDVAVVKDFLHAMLKITGDDFFEISEKIDYLQSDAYNELSNNDLILVLSTTELFRKSIFYWYPEELGGSGKGEEILFGTNPDGNGNNSNSSTAKEKAQIAAEVAAEDCKSLAIGFTVTAFVTAFFPPAGIGCLIGVAAESAISSAVAAVEACIKNKQK